MVTLTVVCACSLVTTVTSVTAISSVTAVTSASAVSSVTAVSSGTAVTSVSAVRETFRTPSGAIRTCRCPSRKWSVPLSAFP